MVPPSVRVGLGRLALACLLTALIAACTEEADPGGPAPSASEEQSATASPSPSSSPTAPSGPLRLSVYGGPTTVRAYQDLAQSFAEEAGQRVEVTTYRDGQRSADRLGQQLDTSGLDESPAPVNEAPDVFLLDSAHLPDLLVTERIHPLDADLEERGLQFGDGYQRLGLTAFSADDRLQCMPVEISPHVLIVNRDHVRPRDLEIRGVTRPDPDGRWDFEDFTAAARVIAREHEDEPRFRAVHTPDEARIVTALIRSAGGEVVDDVDEPTALTLDNDEAKEALTGYLELARRPRVALTAREADNLSALKRFARGDLAMLFGTRADVPRLRESKVRFDVMPLPEFSTYRTVADIAGLCVDSRSARLESALDLVAFAAGNDGSTTLARSGSVLPANLDVAFSPAFAQQGKPPASVEVFLDALNRSGLMPFSSAWADVAARLEAFVGRQMTSPVPVEPVLERRLPQLDARSEEWFVVPSDGESDLTP